MIPKTAPSVQSRRWQKSLADAFRSLPELHRYLGLPAPPPGVEAAAADFPILVTRHFADLMVPGAADDPLLRQVLPTAAETARVDGYVTDPLNEADFSEAGVIRKYPGRVLWIMTGGCPVHCRYCFRRHFPYGEHALGRRHISSAVDRIKADPRIAEVILSGGDPLLLTDAVLNAVFDALARVAHVRRLRIHTRVLNTLPDRIDEGLIEVLRRWSRPLVLVTHVNHPREVSPEMMTAAARLRAAGVLLLNQSVLLRGVNDRVATLAALSDSLVDAGIQPYYLHLLDPVAGAAHFEVNEAEAQALVAALTDQRSGYMVPTLVREIPNRAAKTRISPMQT